MPSPIKQQIADGEYIVLMSGHQRSVRKVIGEIGERGTWHMANVSKRHYSYFRTKFGALHVSREIVFFKGPILWKELTSSFSPSLSASNL